LFPVLGVYDIHEPDFSADKIIGGIAELTDIAGYIDQIALFAGQAPEKHDRALGDDHLGQAQGLLGLVPQGAFLAQRPGLFVAARLKRAKLGPQILQVLLKLFRLDRLSANPGEFRNQLRFGLALVGGHHFSNTGLRFSRKAQMPSLAAAVQAISPKPR